MKYITSPFTKAFLFALGYGIGFYILQFFFAKTGMLPIVPSASNLHAWDVGFYDSIRQNGYNESTHSTGFFIKTRNILVILAYITFCLFYFYSLYGIAFLSFQHFNYLFY